MEALKSILFVLLLVAGVVLFTQYGLPFLGSTISFVHNGFLNLSAEAYDVPYLWIPFAFFTISGLIFWGYHVFDGGPVGLHSSGIHSFAEKFMLSMIGVAALSSAAYWVCGPVAGYAFYFATQFSGVTSILGDMTILFANLVLPIMGVCATFKFATSLLKGAV